jgi:GntR family transcriptional repressor for pyruvate dehydrogenase complex
MSIQKVQIHELVYEKLKEMILSGQYKEGDYLPSEIELAAQIGTSRSALRGAMLLLRKMGIVEVSPGKGTVIKKTVFPGDNGSILHYINNKYKDQIIELLELRIGIEVLAAGLAVERATDEQIAKLRRAYEKMEEDFEENRIGTEADANFHIVLIEIAGNKLLLQIMLSIVGLLKDTINEIRQETFAAGSEESMLELKSHEKILIAIECRDKIGARQITSKNLEDVYKKVCACYL